MMRMEPLSSLQTECLVWPNPGHYFLHVSVKYSCSHVFVQMHMHMCAYAMYTWLCCQVSFLVALYYIEAGDLGEPGAHEFWVVRGPSGPRNPCLCLLSAKITCACHTSLAWVLGI